LSKFRIMTFDGGGVRSVFTAVLLKRLNKLFPQLFDMVHMFAGTSAGSFIALGLAFGLTLDELVNLYAKNAQFIFTPERLGLFTPKYNNENLKMVLNQVFPSNVKLKDLNRYVLVPSFRVIGPNQIPWRPVFFNNFPDSPTRDEPVIDAALASSAAPAYFPSHNTFIDGGVIANNPGLAAVTFAVDQETGRQSLDDIYLLSVGTGYVGHKITADTTEWGSSQWVFYPTPQEPLLKILFEGVEESNRLFSAQLLGERHFRLNPPLIRAVPLDSYRDIPSLIKQAARANIEDAAKWIRENWF